MKFTHSITPKLKFALTLLLLVIILLTGTLIERRFFNSINKSSASIYEDRLVPANEMFMLADQMLERHLLVEDYLFYNTSITKAELNTLIAQNKQRIDTLVLAFEKTFLVTDESESLKNLKRHLANYNRAEEQVINAPDTQHTHVLRKEFMRVHKELKAISDIQLRVGKDLINDANKTMADAHTISDVQLIIIVILCVLAQIFILSSKAISSPIKQKHHLN